jgi:hypothetical protein
MAQKIKDATLVNLSRKRDWFLTHFITWTLDEGPVKVLFFGAKIGVKSHLVVHSNKLHWAPGRPFNTVSSSCVTGIIAPTTSRLFQTLSTGSQSRTILSCMTITLKVFYVT